MSNFLGSRFIVKKFVLLIGVVCLSACASIVEGDQQVVSMETPYCEAARCKLSNEQGTFYSFVKNYREYDNKEQK